MIEIKEKVTIILSTYNATNYIDACLKSIEDQSYDNFNVHIIDDCSSDNTTGVIRTWVKKDTRFKLIDVHQENKGLTRTLNELLTTCDTKYVVRMDADDMMHPDRLRTQMEYLELNKEISVLGSWAQDIDEQGNYKEVRKMPIKNKDIQNIISKVNPIIHPSVIFNRADIIEIGGYNEIYRFAQDYELWFRAVANNLKIENIAVPLLYYRVSSTHAEKRRMSYRMLDSKIRWHGTKAIGCSLPKRIVSASLPIAFGLMPDFLKNYTMSIREKIDPRHKV